MGFSLFRGTNGLWMSKQRDEAIPSRDISINTFSAPRALTINTCQTSSYYQCQNMANITRRRRLHRTGIPLRGEPLFRVNSLDAPTPHHFALAPSQATVSVPDYNNYKATWQSGLMR